MAAKISSLNQECFSAKAKIERVKIAVTIGNMEEIGKNKLKVYLKIIDDA